jgi:hypothetical protein
LVPEKDREVFWLKSIKGPHLHYKQNTLVEIGQALILLPLSLPFIFSPWENIKRLREGREKKISRVES